MQPLGGPIRVERAILLIAMLFGYYYFCFPTVL